MLASSLDEIIHPIFSFCLEEYVGTTGYQDTSQAGVR